MNKEKTNIFPFEYIPYYLGKDEKAKCPFIQNVEKVLQTDLQESDSFGCRIKGSHTHAGSKVHFKDFIEAELLFHNSFYNYGFAYLTVERIRTELKEKSKNINEVVLIGYENYSELYLQEVQSLLQSSQIKCDYCVYETVAKFDGDSRSTTQTIRNLYNDISDKIIQINYGYNFDTTHVNKYSVNNTLFVFIVPINTTLSTMDKMVSLFKKTTGIKYNFDDQCLFLCLITIGSNGVDKKNYYWEYNKDTLILTPQEGRFLEINTSTEVTTFAFIETQWMYGKPTEDKAFCECCFPDKSESIGLTIYDEKPIFDVTRGSVVPMLQLGRKTQLKPVEKIHTIKNKDNLERVWEISNHMAYKHVVRRENHFQYYFDSMGFLNKQSAQESVTEYLQKLRESFISKTPETTTVYNFIVAPRHETNAKWVTLVHNNIFTNDVNRYNPEYDGARVLYFDITKEYRSNIKSKYSDFYRAIQNIEKSGQEAEIRFHYVDETISGGNNFIRAADLIRSLIAGISTHKLKISLFHSIFLLYGRSSADTRMFYLDIFNSIGFNDKQTNNLNKNFHEYVHINNSVMRNYEDACTLCKLTNNYRKIQKYCATNEMADICDIVIENHKECPIEEIEKYHGNFQCSYEKKLLFFISHILNERLSTNNSPIFPKEKNMMQIDVESDFSISKIENVLQDYYDNLRQWLISEKLIKENEITFDDFQNAFIKSISRPFFTFHLRKRTASFAFCIKTLAKEIHKKNDDYNFKLIETLVKALSDMNANYIIRQAPFEKLMHIAHEGDKIEVAKEHKRKYFNSTNYIHSIKKMLSLTQDSTKSLLLERLLVENNEDGFFGEQYHEEMFYAKDFSCGNKLTPKGVLYLENNRIIKDALKDISQGKITTGKDVPYFLDNFKNICEINACEFITEDSFTDFMNSYRNLYDNEYSFNVNINDIDKKLSAIIKLFDKRLSITSFVRDNGVTLNEKDINKLFEFFMLSDVTNTNIKKRFYNDDNFNKLHNILEKNEDSDIIILDNEILIKYRDNAKQNKNIQNVDESIYIKISRFNSNEINHWFMLKIILTLRDNFVNLIKNSNMSVIISERSKMMREAALRINKASTHSNRGVYMNMHFWDKQPVYPLASAYEIPSESSKLPLEKYLQLISNEWISSEYRKTVRDGIYDLEQMDGLYADLSSQYAVADISNEAKFQKDNLVNFFGLSETVNDCPTYNMNFYDENTQQFQSVIIEFRGINNFDNYKYASVLSPIGNMQSLILIITLMAENVIKHNKNETYKLSVEFCDNGDLLLKNVCNNSGFLEKTINLLVCHPWIFNKIDLNRESPHITLWTLKHVYAVLSKVLDNKTSLNIVSDKNSFGIEFKNFLFN